MFKINTTQLPPPSGFAFSTALRCGTVQYNTLGTALPDGLRRKRCFSLEWRRLTPSRQQALWNALTADDTLTFSYPDPTGVQKTAVCYVTGFSERCLRDADSVIYTDIRLDLEEC